MKTPTNDSAWIGLVSETMSVWLMMSLKCNLFGTPRDVDRFQNGREVIVSLDQEKAHNRSRPHRFRWSLRVLKSLLVHVVPLF